MIGKNKKINKIKIQNKYKMFSKIIKVLLITPQRKVKNKNWLNIGMMIKKIMLFTKFKYQLKKLKNDCI